MSNYMHEQKRQPKHILNKFSIEHKINSKIETSPDANANCMPKSIQKTSQDQT